MTDRRQPHARARAWLFWVTLVVAVGEAAVAFVIAYSFAVPSSDESAVPLVAFPILAVVDIVLDVVCLAVGRRANRVLGVVALLAVVAQVLFVVWALIGLSHANFVL